MVMLEFCSQVWLPSERKAASSVGYRTVRRRDRSSAPTATHGRNHLGLASTRTSSQQDLRLHVGHRRIICVAPHTRAQRQLGRCAWLDVYSVRLAIGSKWVAFTVGKGVRHAAHVDACRVRMADAHRRRRYRERRDQRSGSIAAAESAGSLTG